VKPAQQGGAVTAPANHERPGGHTNFAVMIGAASLIYYHEFASTVVSHPDAQRAREDRWLAEPLRALTERLGGTA
jgi:hypothetical protein